MKQLLNLLNKKYGIFTKRGNHSIKLSLELFKNKKTTVFTQDQGGWLTYPQFIKKNKFEEIQVKTNYGIIEKEHLEEIEKKYKEILSNSIFLINSMPGYVTYQNMEIISNFCEKHNIILINDTAGSIGNINATKGDIIIGSFGKSKPMSLDEHGGYIASNNQEYITQIKEKLQNNSEKYDFNLEKNITNLPKKLKYWQDIVNKTIKDLSNLEIIHKDKTKINVIIKYKTEEEKNQITNYVDKNNLEYTQCPRYIRIMNKAISIEIKRKILNKN
jgi:dTDP-4-amino-4,6-dideoxygalactose transaminase